MAITRSQFLQRRRNFFDREEDEDEDEIKRPSDRASFVQKRKQFFEEEKKRLSEQERAEPPEPPKLEKPEEPSIVERVKRFASGLFKEEEEPEEELPAFETAEPEAFESFTIEEARDEYLDYPTFFNNPDQLVNFSQGDIDSGAVVDAADKFIDPQAISESNHPADKFLIATRDFLENHPRSREVLKEAGKRVDEINRKIPFIRGLHKGTAGLFFGSSEAANQYYNQILPQNIEYKEAISDIPEFKNVEEEALDDIVNKVETAETAGEIVATIIHYASATTVGGLVGLGKLTLPVVFNVFAQTSAPQGTTLKQRGLKVPVATVEGYLFSLFPSLRGLSGKDLLVQSAKGIGLSGGTGGVASFIDALIEGKSEEEAFAIAQSAAITYSLFYIAGQAIGILGDEITKSKVIGGQNKRFTPEELREVVKNSGYEKYEAAKQLMQIADEAERAGKNIEIDWVAAKKGWIQRILGDKRSVGVFDYKLADAEPRIRAGEAPTEKGIVPRPETIEPLGTAKTIYRGAKQHDIDISRDNGITGGVSFTEDKAVADRFAERTEGTVKEYTISKDAKVINHSELEGLSREEVSKFLKDNDIDVIRFDVPEGAKGEAELRVVNKEVLQEVSEAEEAGIGTQLPFGKLESQTLKNWYEKGVNADRKKIIDEIVSSPELKDESLRTMYETSIEEGVVPKTLSFQEFLETPIKLYRKGKADVFGNSSWTYTPERTKSFVGDLQEITIKPKETLGSISSKYGVDNTEVLINKNVAQGGLSEDVDTQEAEPTGEEVEKLGKITKGEKAEEPSRIKTLRSELEMIEKGKYKEGSQAAKRGEAIKKQIARLEGEKVVPEKIEPTRKVTRLIENYASGERQIKKLQDIPIDFQEDRPKAERITKEIEGFETGNKSVVGQLVEATGASESEVLNALSNYIDKGEETLSDFYEYLAEEVGRRVSTTEKPAKPEPTKPPEPTIKPKKAKKVAKPKKKRKKPRTTITGGQIKQIPSKKVEKIHKVIKPRSPQLPVLENILVKDGQAQMTDLEIFVSLNTNITDGMYRVKGSDLITLDPKLKLEDEFPIVPKPKKTYGQILPDNITKAIKSAQYYVSGDEMRPLLTGIKFIFEKNKLRLVATDGFRLWNRSYGIKGKKKGEFVVGGIKKLNRILKDVTTDGGVVNLNSGKKKNEPRYISFNNENGRIVVRDIEGEYPDFERIYPPTNRRVVVDKKDFKQAVNDIAPYAKDRADLATLEVQEAQLVLRAEDREGAKKEIELPIKKRDDQEIEGTVEGALIMPARTEEPHIEVNHKFLKDTLLSFENDDIYFSYFVDNEGKVANTNPLVFSDQSEKPITTVKRIAGATVVGKFKAEIIKSGNKYFVRNEETKQNLSKILSSEKAARAYVDGLLDEKNYKDWVGVNTETKTKYHYLYNRKGNEIVKADNTDEGKAVVEAYRDGLRGRATIQDKLGEKKKKVSSKTQASMDRFADIKSVAASMSKHRAIEFPEILQMVRELTGEIPSVSYPRFRPTLGGRPLGLFKQEAEGKIVLNPDVFESPEQAVKTFAHEVGHLADWLPEKTLKRGNLIGHIASLNRFLRHTFSGVATEARIDALKTEEDTASDTRKKEIRKIIKDLRENPDFTLEEVKGELIKVTQMWKPFDEQAVSEQYVDYRYSNAELYADAISVLLNDPQLLRENAPIFYKAFFASLDRKPRVKETYSDTLDLLHKGKDAVLGEREKRIREMFKKGEDLYRVKEEERKAEKYNYSMKLKTQISNLNQAMIDRVNEQEKKGNPVSDEENPKYWLEEGNYLSGKVKTWVETNIQPIVQEIEQSDVTWEDFGEVLLLERIVKERGGTRNPIKMIRQADNGVLEHNFQDFIEQNKDKLPEGMKDYSAKQFLNALEKKSSEKQLEILEGMFSGLVDENGDTLYDKIITSKLPKGIANPLGLDVESATDQLEFLKNKLGKRYEVIERNLPKFRKAVKDLIPQALEAELYQKELAEQMTANEGYATFQVLDYLDVYIPASVKRQIGTLKDVANPATSTIMKSISVIRAIERNKTKRSVVNFLKENYPNDIEDAKTIWTGRMHLPRDPKTRKLKLVTLMEKGKYKGYYVDPYIANSFGTLPTGQSNAILQGLSFFNKGLWRPLFTVYSVRFQTKNFLRDFVRYYKNTPNLSLWRAFASYAKSVKPSVKRAWGITDETISKMENAKILSGYTFGDMLRGATDADKQIEKVIEKAGLSPLKQRRRNFFLKTFMWLPNNIANLGNAIETMPKVAAYQELQGKMPSKELGSFIRTKVGSPDFLMRGTATPVTNNIFLFSNAMVQGLKSDYHAATDPKTRAGWAWKTFMISVLPKLLMFAAEIGLFGIALKRMMKKASEYDKTNYLVIPFGEDANKKAVYFRSPQDETGRMIGGTLWKALRATEDKELTLSDAVQLFSYLGGDIPSVTPTISNLAAIVQFASGRNPYDAYRGRYVIPEREFEAGGKYALKPFITWLFKQSGGNTFFKLGATFQAPETNTWLQDTYEIPIVGDIIESWVKTSDYGQYQENREIINEVKQLRSRELLEQEEVVDKYIKKYQEGDKDNKLELQKELVREVLGTYYPKETQRKTEKSNIIKKYQVGILRGEADPNMNALISSSTNAQKLELLDVLKRTISESEFNDLLKTAKDNKVISDDVYKKAKKL